jgi:hypothetical protein
MVAVPGLVEPLGLVAGLVAGQRQGLEGPPVDG